MVFGRQLPIWLALACAAFAQAGGGYLGTKPSPSMGPMQADTAGSGSMPFLQMMLALGVVLLLLKFVMPKLVGKLNKKIVTRDGSAIRIEESAAFAGGSLYVVQARSKVLLLSVTSAGVNCLSDLTETTPAPSVETFGEMVQRELEGPLQPLAVVQADAFPTASDAGVADALARLERLERLGA